MANNAAPAISSELSNHRGRHHARTFKVTLPLCSARMAPVRVARCVGVCAPTRNQNGLPGVLNQLNDIGLDVYANDDGITPTVPAPAIHVGESV